MKTKTNTILVIMNVLAWITFIGLMVKAGAILVSFGVSVSHPEAAKNLYMETNLYNLMQFDFVHYTVVVVMWVAILILEAYTAFLVTRVLSRIKMTNPFTPEVSKDIEKIAYVILLIWVAAMLYNGYQQWLAKQITGWEENLIPAEFILMVGVVFVFSQIFKKGVEIQSENELTV